MLLSRLSIKFASARFNSIKWYSGQRIYKLKLGFIFRPTYFGSRYMQRMAPIDVCEYLDKTDVSHYDINYDVFKFNHIAQGIISLSELGANAKQIDEYINMVSKELLQPDLSTSDVDYADVPMDELVGKRKGYYLILSHYEKLLKEKYSNDLTLLIRSEFPKLKTGLSGGAFHGIIQIAYGYRAKHAKIVCEGFAYLHYTYQPINARLDNVKLDGDTPITEVLQSIRENRELIQYRWDEPQRGDWAKIHASKFGRALAPLLEQKVGELLKYVENIRLPDISGFDDTKSAYLHLMNWILKQAIVVYISSERRNDFFLLHGVTSGWSVLKVIEILEDDTEIFQTILTFVCCLLGTYLVRGCPQLSLKYCEDRKGSSSTWEEIVDNSLNNRTVEVETHVYKMVYICHDLSKSDYFKESGVLLKNAALVAMDNGFPDLPDRAGL